MADIELDGATARAALDVYYASAAQGAKADTATQPGDLGTAAAQNVEAFATGAEGDLAATATQPGDLGGLAVKSVIAVPADITATGTASSTTFLRGDAVWASPAGGGDLLAANNLSDVAVAATALSNLGGATAAQGALADSATQPGDLGTLATQNDIAVPADITATGTPSSSTYLRGDGAWAAPAGGGGGDLLAANNLSDLINAATARTNLGLGTAATTASSAYQPVDAVLTNTTASFLVADETKLDGIEALADVTDVTNVTAAGALMDSEVDANLKTLVLPASTTITAAAATVLDDVSTSAMVTTLGAATAAQGALADSSAQKTANLSDLANASTARTNLGLGTAATTASTAYATSAQGTTADSAIQPADTPADMGSVPSTTQTGTTYTLALADAKSMVYFSNAAQVTVTIPLAASVNFADGDRILLLSTGAGGLTLSVTSITLLGSSPNLTIAQNEGIYLENISSDTWAVVGGTAA